MNIQKKTYAAPVAEVIEANYGTMIMLSGNTNSASEDDDVTFESKGYEGSGSFWDE